MIQTQQDIREFNPRVTQPPEHLRARISESIRQKERFCLMLVDLEHFKAVNDTQGHDAGNLALQQSANLILNTVRSGGFVFRCGGEELLVLLVNVSPEASLKAAHTIRERVETTTFSIGDSEPLHITCSIGLALFDGHPDYQHLIKRADEALYEAKNSGRNQVCIR